MKTNLSKQFIAYFFIFLLLQSESVRAVVWVGSTTSDVYASVDPNLVLDGSGGDIILPTGPRIIDADTGNITVTLINGPVVVRGNPEGPSQLFLTGSAGNTITFEIQSTDLSFKGSIDDSTDPLLVYVAPTGVQVVIQISGGQNLSFTSDTGSSGGALAYVELGANNSSIFFQRFSPDGNPNADATITIGANSLMSFTNGWGTGTGSIQFDASNPIGNIGRMILNIESLGGFIIRPTVVGSYTGSPTLTDINTTLLGNGTALVNILNPVAGAQGSLEVVNGNTALFDLMIDPFLNLNARNDLGNYAGSFSGTQYGFVLGANSALQVGDNAFLDYVGTSSDICPVLTTTSVSPSMVAGTIKKRNPSAFFVDGSNNPGATPASINLGNKSALYFRSGVDNLDVIENPTAPHQWTITPTNRTPGAGFVVFDIEGPLNVTGSDVGTTLLSKIELLSLEVNFTGGPLFYNGSEIIFPERTFALDGNGQLYQYNNACFLVNNEMSLTNVVLDHTDENHRVYANNDIQSEPAYIGGETFTLLSGTPRPSIAFINSYFLVHTDVALTGVDLEVPNSSVAGVCSNNISHFTFFYNGRAVDNGTGRQMILGTTVGSFTCNGCTIVSDDSHLDIIQDTSCTNTTAPSVDQLLILDVAANTTVVNNQVPPFPTSIQGQYSVQTIFLGHASNISIGTNAPSTGFTNNTSPELQIAGNFFSFATRGGNASRPDFSSVTGQGGIFVDLNGTFEILPQYRASIGVMVTRSQNGIISLPENQVYFDNLVGITNWKINLVDPAQAVVIGVNEYLSDYTLFWQDITKDFSVFSPYVVDSVNSCSCPPVVTANITSLPTVLGTVDQLQIQGSRIGDEAHVVINGGFVRELVFLEGCDAADAATAFIILDNNAFLGLNTAKRNTDSIFTEVKLGVNGVSFIANGSAEILMNDDTEIDNICSFLTGPDFGTTNTLRLTSYTGRVLTLKKTGILDLRSFGAGQTIEFGGDIQLVCEPGAQIYFNGGIVRFSQSAALIIDTVDKAQTLFQDIISTESLDNSISPTVIPVTLNIPHNQYAPVGTAVGNVTITDPYRVKLIGAGTLQFAEKSTLQIKRDSFLGVETLFDYNTATTCQIPVTNLTLELVDEANVIVGTQDPEEEAGTFQIGNTTPIPGHSVSFTLLINGADARFNVNRRGFFGLGAGIVNKVGNVSNWFVDTLFDVASITINVAEGLFAHDRIFDTDSSEGSLMAIGNVPTLSLLYVASEQVQPERLDQATIHGGGNLVLISTGTTGPLHPIVLATDNQLTVNGIVLPRLLVGIFSSDNLLPVLPPTNVTPSVFFNSVKSIGAQIANGRDRGLVNIASTFVDYRPARTPVRTGFIWRGQIIRFDVDDVANGITGFLPQVSRQTVVDIGAAYVKVNNNDPYNQSVMTQII